MPHAVLVVAALGTGADTPVAPALPGFRAGAWFDERVREEWVAGIKKDVVVTNRLAEKPNRVAIYGWHKTDGKPIHPLMIVHVDWYVDYSHGVRLMRRAVAVDGKSWDVRHVLYSAGLHGLLSDEGPVTRPAY